MAQAWLLHKIIDGFCGRAYPAHQDYHSVWNSAEWKHVLEDVTTFFKAVVGKNFSEEEDFWGTEVLRLMQSSLPVFLLAGSAVSVVFKKYEDTPATEPTEFMSPRSCFEMFKE
ncbi:COMM domain containing 8, isoform CRA_b [Mus musculus]|nr:COMM domain containing 8, isoform CRA_b [Mus musculus]